MGIYAGFSIFKVLSVQRELSLGCSVAAELYLRFLSSKSSGSLHTWSNSECALKVVYTPKK